MALSIMMIGDSKNMPSEKATPKAARLNVGSPRRAMMAAMKGPSTPIISQVEKRGSQKAAIFLRVSSGVWGFKAQDTTIPGRPAREGPIDLGESRAERTVTHPRRWLYNFQATQ